MLCYKKVTKSFLKTDKKSKFAPENGFPFPRSIFMLRVSNK